MMNTHDMEKSFRWNGFAASIPGGGHIRRGIPCQDASAVMIAPRPAVIVCDGRGSASLSHFGAQDAVRAFRFQTSVLEPFLVNILDSEEEKPEQWIKFCRIMYRTLMQVKYDLAEQHNTNEKEFDCTVAFAIAGTKHIGCFQVGDGSIVLRQNGVCKTVFPPEKGEFANQTHFLRAGGEEALKFQYTLMDTAVNSGIAVTSDGPEHLMFHLSDMTPGKIFDMFLEDLRREELTKQDLMDYLTRREWADDPRGSDDRSLAVLARIGVEPVTLPEPEIVSAEEIVPEVKVEPAQAAVTEPEVAEQTAVGETSVPTSEPEVKAEPEPETVTEPKAEEKSEVNASESVPEVKKKALKYGTLATVCALTLGLLAETAYLLKQTRTIDQQRQEIQSLNLELLEAKEKAEQTQPKTQPQTVPADLPADTGGTSTADETTDKNTIEEDMHHAE